MTEKKKETLLTIDNVRVIQSDPLNLAIERLEEVQNPKDGTITNKWRHKGYSGSILGALQTIQYKELLIDYNAVNDLENHLKQVEESNNKLIQAKEGLAL